MWASSTIDRGSTIRTVLSRKLLPALHGHILFFNFIYGILASPAETLFVPFLPGNCFRHCTNPYEFSSRICPSDTSCCRSMPCSFHIICSISTITHFPVNYNRYFAQNHMKICKETTRFCHLPHTVRTRPARSRLAVRTKNTGFSGQQPGPSCVFVRYPLHEPHLCQSGVPSD